MLFLLCFSYVFGRCFTLKKEDGRGKRSIFPRRRFCRLALFLSSIDLGVLASLSSSSAIYDCLKPWKDSVRDGGSPFLLLKTSPKVKDENNSKEMLEKRVCKQEEIPRSREGGLYFDFPDVFLHVGKVEAVE